MAEWIYFVALAVSAAIAFVIIMLAAFGAAHHDNWED